MRKKFLLLAILLAAGAAVATAQQMPAPGGHVPAAEELATLPGASAAQQAEIRKILLQRRDAQETLRESMRAQFDALHTKERSEHERIDDQASAQLRKLLGDDGYRAYAEWTLAHRGPPHGMGPPPGADGHFGPGMGGRPERGAPALPPPPPGAPSGGHAAPDDAADD